MLTLPEEFLIDIDSISGKLLFLSICAFAGLFLSLIVFQVLKLFLKSTLKTSGQLINKKLRAIFSLFFVVVALNIALPAAELEGIPSLYLKKFLYILFISCFAFLLAKVAEFVRALVYERHDISIENNLRGRKIRTQIDFVYKLIAVIIFLIAVSVILMSFDPVRQLGTSLLASAGIAGIILGLAAQRSITNLLAGFQIAFTQPIRIDDVVIVEGEWGRIEEITLTYVVMRIWDQRRLIIPISYFIEKPFQNWTRVSADLLGKVFIYADYSIPVEAIREELTRILKESNLWDEKVNNVVVTEATEKSIQIRALFSGKNSGAVWDLSCVVREKLIHFIQKEYPESLPKLRVPRVEETPPVQ